MRTLESYFFRTYIQRFPNSKTDAQSFALDLRDFYRVRESLGCVPDARFAELVYRLRKFIVERLELYDRLDSDDGDFDQRFDQLFLR